MVNLARVIGNYGEIGPIRDHDIRPDRGWVVSSANGSPAILETAIETTAERRKDAHRVPFAHHGVARVAIGDEGVVSELSVFVRSPAMQQPVNVNTDTSAAASDSKDEQCRCKPHGDMTSQVEEKFKRLGSRRLPTWP